MTVSLWLAGRDARVRWRRAALAAAVVGALAAASTATELVARAREEAIAARIDDMGPALTVVPRGVSAAALARLDLGERALPPRIAREVERALGAELRAIEPRLVATRAVDGAPAPVIGVDAPDVPRGGAVLGSELARRVGRVASVEIAGAAVAVAGARPSTASAEDLAVLLPLDAARALTGLAGANELRLYLRAGVSPRGAEARLAAAGLEAATVRSDRGEVADGETHAALVRHRTLAYAVLASVAALCLLVFAHLDAAERRVELATLVAIGAPRRTVLGALVARSALGSAAGATLGVAAGAALAGAQDPAVVAALARAWPVAVATISVAFAVGGLAAAPTAIAAAIRDPVPDLQES